MLPSWSLRIFVKCILACWVLLGLLVSAHGAQSARFASIQPTLEIDPTLLSTAEREFLSAHPVVRVVVPRANFEPFQFINDQGEIAGGAIETLLALTAALGVKLEPVVVDTWPDVLTAIRNRQADLVAYIGYASERDEYMDFTVGIAPDPAVLVGRKDDKRLELNPQLEGLRVAVGKGFISQKHLGIQHPDAIPVPVTDIEAAIAAVLEGTADYYFGDLLPAMRHAEKYPDHRLEVKRQVFYASGWAHIAVRSDWRVLTVLLSRLINGHQSAIYRGFEDRLTGPTGSFVQPLSLNAQESQTVAQFGTLRVGAVRDLKLLNSVTKDGLHTGIASEYTSYLSHKLALPIETIPFDTIASMIDGARNGTIDLIPFFTPTEARQTEFSFTAPFLQMPFVLIGRLGDTLYWDLQSLAGKTLALTSAHPLLPILQQDFPRVQILEVESGQEALQAVADGGADAAVEVKLFANSLLNTQFAGQLRLLTEIEQLPAGFAFAAPKNATDLIDIVDRALASMPADERQRANRRWVAVDFEPERQLRQLMQITLPIVAGLLVLAATIGFWNRRLVRENKRRLRAEQQLVDMTDRLRTGVFQFRQLQSGQVETVFTNQLARDFGRVGELGGPRDYRRFFNWVHPDDKAHVLKMLDRSLALGEPFREAFRFSYPSGEPGWIIAEASARCEDDGTTVWSGYLFDLTSERRLSEQLDASLSAKDQFLTIAGHELRAPVHNAAIAMTAIKGTEITDSQKPLFDALDHSLTNMSEMINDLLDLGRADSRELVLSVRPTNLRQLIETVVASFESSMQEKNLAFTSLVRADVPVSMSLDRTRLRQILYNLLGNAQKYTDRGSVRLTVACSQLDADDSWASANGLSRQFVAFEVEDTGIGIPSEDIDSIFEPFRMLGPADRRSTGLGLAVVQRLCVAMGGQIQVKSTVGIGSVFTVTLPLMIDSVPDEGNPADTTDKRPDASAIGASDNSAVKSSASTQILLVDDDRLGRIMLAMLLRSCGFVVLEADSAEQAHVMTRTSAVDVVITDYQMPGASGLDLAKQIRGDLAPGKRVPLLVAITGGMPSKTHSLASEVFDVILVKPVSAGQIEALIRSRMPLGAIAAA